MSTPLDDHLIERPAERAALASYREYFNEEEAKEFVQLLRDADLPFSLDRVQTLLDKSIVGDAMLPKVVLKVRPEDFKRVNQLIEAELNAIDASTLDEHYLNELDNEELIDILRNRESWTTEAIVVARKLLKRRGVAVNYDALAREERAKLEQARSGKPGNRVWMVGYALATVLGPLISVLFLVAGLGMGYYYAYGKTTDVDGHTHFIYDPATRRLGQYLWYLGLVVSAVVVMLYLIPVALYYF